MAGEVTPARWVDAPGELRFELRRQAGWVVWFRLVTWSAAIGGVHALDTGGTTVVLLVGALLLQVLGEAAGTTRELVRIDASGAERLGPLRAWHKAATVRPETLGAIERVGAERVHATSYRREELQRIAITVAATPPLGGEYAVPFASRRVVEDAVGTLERVEEQEPVSLLPEELGRVVPALSWRDPVSWLAVAGAAAVLFVLAERQRLGVGRYVFVGVGVAMIGTALWRVAKNDARVRYEGLRHEDQDFGRQAAMLLWALWAILGIVVICAAIYAD